MIFESVKNIPRTKMGSFKMGSFKKTKQSGKFPE